jgi:hypothetical protein
MRELTFFGVTFSITMKAGRRRTVVGSSYFVECDGVGMFEADSMSLWTQIRMLSNNELRITDPIADLHISLLVNSLHNTPLLIRHIPHPIRLPRRNQNMRTPPLHIPIQLITLVNLKSPRIIHVAALTIMIAILSINRGIYFQK